MTSTKSIQLRDRTTDDDLFRSIMSGLSTLGVLHEYSKDVVICRQDTHADHVYLLESGVVALYHIPASGHQSLIGIRRQPWISGTHNVLTHQPSAVRIETLSPCVVRMIPAAIFLEAWQRNADFSWALHKIHCADLEDYERRIVELTCHTSRERLEEFIWELTAESPTPRCRAQIPLKIAQLSQLLAISLPHLNTLFQHLEDDGILRRIDGWLLIPNRNLLWRSNTHPRDRR